MYFNVFLKENLILSLQLYEYVSTTLIRNYMLSIYQSWMCVNLEKDGSHRRGRTSG